MQDINMDFRRNRLWHVSQFPY